MSFRPSLLGGHEPKAFVRDMGICPASISDWVILGASEKSIFSALMCINRARSLSRERVRLVERFSRFWHDRLTLNTDKDGCYSSGPERGDLMQIPPDLS